MGERDGSGGQRSRLTDDDETLNAEDGGDGACTVKEAKEHEADEEECKAEADADLSKAALE